MLLSSPVSAEPPDDDFDFQAVPERDGPKETAPRPAVRPAPTPPAPAPARSRDDADTQRLDDLVRAGRTGEALVQCERIQIRYATRKEPLPRPMALRCGRAHVAQGDKLFSLRAAAEAQREWRAAVSLDPSLIDDPAYVRRLTLDKTTAGQVLPALRPLPRPAARPAPTRPVPAPARPAARPTPSDGHDLGRLDEFEDGRRATPAPADDDGFVPVPELERPARARTASARTSPAPERADPFERSLGDPTVTKPAPPRPPAASPRRRTGWGAPPSDSHEAGAEDEAGAEEEDRAEEEDEDLDDEADTAVEDDDEPEEPPGPRAGRHFGLGLGFGYDGLMSVAFGWMYDELISVEASVGLVFPTLDSRIRIYGFRFPVTPVVGVGMLTPFHDKDYYGAGIGYFPDLYTHGASFHLDVGVSWAPIEQIDVYAGVAFLTTLDFDDLDQLVMFPMWSVQALWYF